MKPKNLKFPYRWQDRKPEIRDQVFYLPDYYPTYDQYFFPSWDTIFPEDLPICIEYGAGNGSWSIEKAKSGLMNWVVVEKRFERVRQIWSKMKNQNLKNFFIVCGRAEIFTHYFLPKNSIVQVFINFPDPWPKDRHAKHRIFQQPFIDDLSVSVKPQGTATIVTDDPNYANEIWQLMKIQPYWASYFNEPGFVTHLENYGSSYFDSLWRQKGKTIHYFQFKKL